MQLEEKSLGRFRFGGYVKSLTVSQDCRHVAYVKRNMWLPFLRRDSVVLDGVQSRNHGRILPDSVAFLASGSPVFVASRRQQMFCVVDDKKCEPFHAVTALTVCSDGKRFAYVAGNAGRAAVVVDRIPGQWFDAIADGSLAFSPDGRHVGYAARRASEWRCVVDGTEGARCDAVGKRSLSFSNDGSRFAYTARDGSTWRVVVDGVPQQQPWHGIADGTPVFAPTGQRFAYAATDGRHQFVVIDEQTYGPYDGVGNNVTFSQNGAAVAFRARTGRDWTVVSNSRSSAPYESVSDSSPVLSADGRRLAFVGHRRGKAILAIDGVDAHVHDEVVHPTFSHSGARMAYAARDGHRWNVFVDDRSIIECTGVTSELVFSPDDNHVAVEVNHFYGRPLGVALNIDGSDRARVDVFLRGARPTWDGTAAVHNLGMRGREYILVSVNV